jgi:protein SCO1/2
MATKGPLGLRIFQATLWGLVLVAATYMIGWRFLVPADHVTSTPVAVSGAPTSLGPGVAMNTPFQLINEDGQAVTEVDFAGKPGAWFYGFTNCPDVCPHCAGGNCCPNTASLGPDADEVECGSSSPVDPERDTLGIIKGYVDYFDPRIIGLTGTLANVEAMTKARFVQFEKVPREDGAYAMQHPASIYLVDANGEFAGTLDAEEPMDTKLSKLKKLVGA